MKTLYGKSIRGGFRADSMLAMDATQATISAPAHKPGDRVMTICTYKGPSGMVTHAHCSILGRDGCLTTELFGDFSKRVLLSSSRCTEANVRTQHDAVVGAQCFALLAEANAFYAAKSAA